jgi:hypothetical protein
MLQIQQHGRKLFIIRKKPGIKIPKKMLIGALGHFLVWQATARQKCIPHQQKID